MFKLCITNSYGLESWKDIEGYECQYQVSTLGNIKSLNYRHTGEEKVLKAGDNGVGYQMVALYKDGKVKFQKIHRLVAKAWLPTAQSEQTEVNHKDEVKTNNKVENLGFCTRKENCNYGTRNERVAKAKLKPIIQMDKQGNMIAEFPSVMEASRQTGIYHSSIVNCCNGRYKSAGGYKWGYKWGYK